MGRGRLDATVVACRFSWVSVTNPRNLVGKYREHHCDDFLRTLRGVSPIGDVRDLQGDFTTGSEKVEQVRGFLDLIRARSSPLKRQRRVEVGPRFGSNPYYLPTTRMLNEPGTIWPRPPPRARPRNAKPHPRTSIAPIFTATVSDASCAGRGSAWSRGVRRCRA
jgi:hypothetical protein